VDVRGSPPALRVVDLGMCGYREAYQRQLDEVERRGTRYVDGVPVPAPAIDDTLLLVEHPHVITLGRSRAALGNVLAAGDVEVVEIERGGDVTYHGPGQLVAYPIAQLAEGERDLHRFLRSLEEAVIRTLARWDLDADREVGATGVWLDGRGGRKKICSIGIACRRWVTFHGLALNVATDLGYFQRINPCGFESGVMTSMAEELGVGIEMRDVKVALAVELAAVLGRQLA
jgi:lipoyl(octanoyl) transferase